MAHWSTIAFPVSITSIFGLFGNHLGSIAEILVPSLLPSILSHAREQQEEDAASTANNNDNYWSIPRATPTDNATGQNNNNTHPSNNNKNNNTTKTTITREENHHNPTVKKINLMLPKQQQSQSQSQQQSIADQSHSHRSQMFNTSLASEHRGSVTDIIRSMEAEEQQEEKHVLVVDDDNISRTVMSRMLEKLNFKGKCTTINAVIVFCNMLLLLYDWCTCSHIFIWFFLVTTVDGGKKALELLGEDNSVSLVLVDVLMPEMDGLELLRIFKSAYAKDIPIISMCLCFAAFLFIIIVFLRELYFWLASHLSLYHHHHHL